MKMVKERNIYSTKNCPQSVSLTHERPRRKLYLKDASVRWWYFDWSYILGNLNCKLLSEVVSNNSSHDNLLNIVDHLMVWLNLLQNQLESRNIQVPWSIYLSQVLVILV